MAGVEYARTANIKVWSPTSLGCRQEGLPLPTAEETVLMLRVRRFKEPQATEPFTLWCVVQARAGQEGSASSVRAPGLAA